MGRLVANRSLIAILVGAFALVALLSLMHTTLCRVSSGSNRTLSQPRVDRNRELSPASSRLDPNRILSHSHLGDPESGFEVVQINTIPSYRMALSSSPPDVDADWLKSWKGLYMPQETIIFRHLLGDVCGKFRDNNTAAGSQVAAGKAADSSLAPWVVDVGANWGYFGLYALAMGCRVVFFEPNPLLQEAIETSISLNDGFADRSLLIRSAASNRAGLAEFFLRKGRSGMNSVGRGSSSGGTNIWVQTINAASVLNDLGIKRAELVKVDTEGFEDFVWEGFESFSGVVHNWIIEVKFHLRGANKKKWLRENSRTQNGKYIVHNYAEAYNGPFEAWKTLHQPRYQLSAIDLTEAWATPNKEPAFEDFWLSRI